MWLKLRLVLVVFFDVVEASIDVGVSVGVELFVGVAFSISVRTDF